MAASLARRRRIWGSQHGTEPLHAGMHSGRSALWGICLQQQQSSINSVWVDSVPVAAVSQITAMARCGIAVHRCCSCIVRGKIRVTCTWNTRLQRLKMPRNTRRQGHSQGEEKGAKRKLSFAADHALTVSEDPSSQDPVLLLNLYVRETALSGDPDLPSNLPDHDKVCPQTCYAFAIFPNSHVGIRFHSVRTVRSILAFWSFLTSGSHKNWYSNQQFLLVYVYMYIQIYFQTGKLQMKSRSPKFP